MQDKAGTIVLFECHPKGRPVYRHEGGMILVFVDGHVKGYPKGTITPGM